MMTVEERAKKAFDAFMNVHYMNLSDEMVMNAIIQALRDQIEDCAKVADRWERTRRRQSQTMMAIQANEIATEIRALAAPTKQIEGKK